MRQVSAGIGSTRLLGVACLAVALSGSAGAAADVPITVRTTDCNGQVGMASFDADRLFRIQADDCPDPEDGSRMLQQVLLKSEGGLTRYEVLQVTEAEAEKILAKVDEIGRAELENLTRPDVVVERIETTRELPERPASTRSASGGDAGAPPALELLDPPLAGTRSLTSVLIDPQAERRVLVGRASAASGILSLSVNGTSQELDGNGLFKADVATRPGVTPVTIVAVDEQGRSSTVEFELVRREPEAAGPAAAEGNPYGRYHALVIANDEYQQLDDLTTPANDAAAIGRLLRERYGFEVTTLSDGTRYDILSALNDLRARLTEDDNLLIYFAGHGAYDRANNRGHWLPVDAERDSTANWVSTIDITDLVNAMSARHVLVVADSCYSGALSRSAQTNLDPGMSDDLRARWLRAIAQTRSRHVLTSGGLKPVPDDGGNGHSIFANALIEVLSEGEGVIESSEIYRKVKQRVDDRARELQVDQTPDYAQLKRTGHEYGEFLLVTRSP